MVACGGMHATTPSCTQVLVAQKVTAGVYKGVTTTELDELAAETAASLTATHPDYALVCLLVCAVHAALIAMYTFCQSHHNALQLAARVAVSNLHKQTLKSFSETYEMM